MLYELLFSVSFLSWVARIKLRLGRVETVSCPLDQVLAGIRATQHSDETEKKVSKNAQNHSKNLVRTRRQRLP